MRESTVIFTNIVSYVPLSANYRGVSETSSSIVGHTYLYFELRNSLQQNYVKERNARYVRRLSAVSPRGDKAYEIAGSSTNSDSRRAESSFRVRERNTPNSHPLSHLPVIVRSRNRTEKNVSTNESSSLEARGTFRGGYSSLSFRSSIRASSLRKIYPSKNFLRSIIGG